MALVSLLLGQPQKGTRVDRSVGGSTASIVLDATVSEDYSAPIEITTHPVEEGSDISDHVILRPQKLKIEGKITETPFDIGSQAAGVVSSVAASIGQSLGGALGGVLATAGAAKTLAGVLKPKSAAGTLNADGTFSAKDVPAESTRLRDAVTEFKNIRDAKVPVTIVTGLQQYTNYLLAGFEVKRGTDTGGSINVSLEFQELQIASSTTVKVEVPKNKNGLPTANQGKKKANPLEGEKAKKSSFLLQGIKGIGNLF